MDEIDVSVLLNTDQMFAVNCTTQEEADRFIEFLKLNYPERARWSGSPDHHEWPAYKERTCYSPCLNGKGAQGRLTYYYKEWFPENGYTVIDFRDLCVPVPEINQDEFAGLFNMD